MSCGFRFLRSKSVVLNSAAALRCSLAHRLVFYVVGLEWKMAKKRSTVVIRLVSQAGTGFFYTLRKAVRANAEKLQLMKHDPRVNAHVLFKEEKIKKK